MTTEISITIADAAYTASIENSRVEIHRDGVWAGTGRWDGRIVDCAADLGDDVYEALDEALVDAIDAAKSTSVNETVSNAFRAAWEAHPQRDTDPALALTSARETAAESIPAGVTGDFNDEELTFTADDASKSIDAVALAADLDKRGAWDWTDDSDHDPCDRYAVVQVAGGWALVYAGTEPAEVWLHDSHAAAAAHMQDAISE